MAIGSPIVFPYPGNERAQVVRPVSISGGWQVVIDAGGMDDVDNAGADIDIPDTQIVLATRHISTLPYGMGTNLLLMMGWDDGATVSVNPVVQVFGRAGTGDKWMRLQNKDGDVDITIQTSSNDMEDGTLRYTTPSLTAGIIDLLGCIDFVVGVKTALAMSAGVATNALLYAKVI